MAEVQLSKEFKGGKKMSNSKKFYSVIASIIFIACLAIIGVTLFQNNVVADDQAIQNVISSALEATHGSLTSLPSEYQTDNKKEIPSDVIKARLNNITKTLSEIYSSESPLLATRIGNMQELIYSQVNGKDRELGGGFRWIKNSSLSVNNKTATFEADIRVWAKYLDGANNQVITPENTCHYVYTLKFDNGKWKITGESFNFLPGEEP